MDDSERSDESAPGCGPFASLWVTEYGIVMGKRNTVHGELGEPPARPSFDRLRTSGHGR